MTSRFLSKRSRLLIAASLGASLLAGCQATSPTKDASSQAPAFSSTANNDEAIYLRVYEKSKVSGGISLVDKGIPLQRAIHHAYPDVALLSDEPLDLSKPVDVWAKNLTPNAYLRHLGQQMGLLIQENGRGDIEIRHTDQWAFTVPSSEDDLLDQAKYLAYTYDVPYTVLGSGQNASLLFSGPVPQVRHLRRALGQLGDQVRLERSLRPVEAHQP